MPISSQPSGLPGWRRATSTPTTPHGTPNPNRFAVTVDGVLRDVTAVSIKNDSPPNKATVTLTLAGDPLAAGAAVTVQYRQLLLASGPQLQDLDSLLVTNFGPVTVPVTVPVPVS